MIDIKYVDGKPVRVKTNELKELRKELKPEEPENTFDTTKRELYAELPQAQAKKDRSITARSLNTMLESFNANRTKYRNETKFELARLKMPNAPYCSIYVKAKDSTTPIWAFTWTFADSTIKSTKEPVNGYKLSWKSLKFSKFDNNLLPAIYKKLEEHIKRRKP